MYDIIIEQEISSGHKLRGYQGKCENVHGHNWKIRLEVSRPELDDSGLAIDFNDLKKILQGILEKYDHRMLNDLPEFAKTNPTSENLARIIYQECKTAIVTLPIQMIAVTVWESSKASIRYYE
ncbi:6-carboxytetrahydropterin synthase QueD [bacterium]|nr:6-carboxytetrahydropterin synthase QueD [bacterium]